MFAFGDRYKENKKTLRLFLTPFSPRGTILESEITEVSFGRIRRKTAYHPDDRRNTMVEHHRGLGMINHFADRLGALNQSVG